MLACLIVGALLGAPTDAHGDGHDGDSGERSLDLLEPIPLPGREDDGDSWDEGGSTYDRPSYYTAPLRPSVFGIRVAPGLRLRVHDELRDAGIEIPFPQRDLHLRTVDATGRNILGVRSDDSPSTTDRSKP